MGEVFGGIIVVVWFAIVIWGIAMLVIQAKRKNSWETVGVGALSAATVAGPLLFVFPDHVFIDIHTMGFGAVLAVISGIGWMAYASSRRRPAPGGQPIR